MFGEKTYNQMFQRIRFSSASLSKTNSLLLLTIICISVLACSAPPPEPVCNDAIGCVHIASHEPIKVAVLQMLSGENEVIGVEQLRAVELAVQDRKGTLLNRPVELQAVDSHCSPEGGTTAALRVAADPRIVGIIGTSCSGSAISALEVLNGTGIPMISASNTAASLTRSRSEPGGHHISGYFRTALNDDLIGIAAAAFAVEALGLTRAATIDDGDPYTQGLARAFGREFEARGGTLALAATINKGDVDMNPVLKAILRTEPELLFYPVFRPEGDWVTQAIYQSTLERKLVLLSADGLFSEPFLNQVGDAAINMHFVIPTPVSGPGIEDFNRQYEQQYGEWPVTFFHVYARDAAELLLLALEKTAITHPDGSLTIGRHQLIDELHSTQFEGLTGWIDCNTLGDCSGQGVSVVQVVNPALSYQAITENIVFNFSP